MFQGWVLAPKTAAARRARRSTVMRFVGGDVSYPRYLIHLPPVYACMTKTPVNGGPANFLAAPVAAALYLSVDSYSRRRHLRGGEGRATA